MFCPADVAYVIQTLSRGHYNCCTSIAQTYTVTHQLLNQINTIRTLNLPFLFRYKHIASLESLPSPAPSESLLHWFQSNFAVMFVLNCWLREFPLSAFANGFEWRCEPKQLMLLYYKICPCSFVHHWFGYEFLSR